MVISPLNTTITPDDTGHPALLDLSALDALLGALDQDTSALESFVGTFVDHWPERLRRAEKSIVAGDRAAIYDCALSIKVASQMVGAVWLSACGSQLELLARADRLDQAAELLEVLHTVGDETVSKLTAVLNLDLAA